MIPAVRSKYHMPSVAPSSSTLGTRTNGPVNRTDPPEGTHFYHHQHATNRQGVRTSPPLGDQSLRWHESEEATRVVHHNRVDHFIAHTSFLKLLGKARNL